MPLLRIIHWLEDRLPGYLLAAMTGLVIIDVCGRYLSLWSVAGGAEIATALFVWLVFLGSAAAVRKLQHIGIGGVAEYMPTKVLVWLKLLICIVILLACLHVTRISFNLANASWGREIDMVGIPYFYVYLIIPLSFALMTLHTSMQIVDILRRGSESEVVAGRATRDSDV